MQTSCEAQTIVLHEFNTNPNKCHAFIKKINSNFVFGQKEPSFCVGKMLHEQTFSLYKKTHQVGVALAIINYKPKRWVIYFGWFTITRHIIL